MAVTNQTLFKVTGPKSESCWGGKGQWYKPHSQKRAGKWMPLIKDIIPCERGYHVCKGQQVLRWLGPELYEVEIRGEQIRESNKIVAEQARLVRKITTWNERTARLFACDCAKRVLHLFEEKYPEDNGPKDAIAVARRYANEKATEIELRTAKAAADCAAHFANYKTARAAASATAYTVYNAFEAYTTFSATSATTAAYYAAYHAAYHAISAAASTDSAHATHDKECKWQYNRLLKYLNGEIS